MGERTVTHIEGRLLTPDGWVTGRITVAAGRIAEIAVVEGSNDRLVLPGFVDLHCHGGLNADVMDSGDAVRTVARLHARHGTTSLLATTMTAPIDEIESALKGVAPAVTQRNSGEARVLGVHLEGPFISPERLGAQPPFAIPADVSLMARLCELAPIRVVTCAPEIDPRHELRDYLVDRKIRVQIGHSNCDYETASESLREGASGITHIFNAMSPLHQRAPGVVGAALAHASFCEVIPDLLHVSPGAIRAVLRAIPSVYAVSDATAATGMPDGTYRLGRHSVHKSANGVRLADGTLAGSCLTMAEAFSNLIKIGLSIEEASRRTSTIAADYLRNYERGRLTTGAYADVVVFDREMNLVEVLVEGEHIEPAVNASVGAW
jgi:N-acetylglucosamine-6-phosphate deacetylase